jgi:hypothetical protein
LTVYKSGGDNKITFYSREKFIVNSSHRPPLPNSWHAKVPALETLLPSLAAHPSGSN